MKVIEVNAQSGETVERDMTPEEIGEINAAKAAEAARWSRDHTINAIRGMRDIALNRLTGIGFAATIAGDAATVSAVLAARQSLLDLTKDQGVLAAGNEAELVAALQTRYAQIVASTPENVRSAFRDIRL